MPSNIIRVDRLESVEWLNYQKWNTFHAPHTRSFVGALIVILPSLSNVKAWDTTKSSCLAMETFDISIQVEFL